MSGPLTQLLRATVTDVHNGRWFSVSYHGYGTYILVSTLPSSNILDASCTLSLIVQQSSFVNIISMYGRTRLKRRRLMLLLANFFSVPDSENREIRPELNRSQTDLHWLPIQAHIQFKLNVITRSCLVGQAPAYLTELCRPINEIPARRNLRSATQVQLLVPRFCKERSDRCGFFISSSHHRSCGTCYQLKFDSYTRGHNFSEIDSKLIVVHSSPVRIYATSVTSSTSIYVRYTSDVS